MTNVVRPQSINGSDPANEVEGHSFKLKQTGGRPVQFRGIELCSAMSYVPGTPLWYEINIYKTEESDFVTDVRMFTKDENERDVFRVERSYSLADVFDYLEKYDAANDVDASSVDLGSSHLSVANLSLSAASLRIRVEEARGQFRDLVGQILYQLEHA